jgi:hypothetical protein
MHLFYAICAQFFGQFERHNVIITEFGVARFNIIQFNLFAYIFIDILRVSFVVFSHGFIE